jgi:pyroglutamyl-peptidase
MRKAPTILVTGFGPFPGAPINPTAALAQALARLRRPAFAGTRRIAHVFATRYGAVDSELAPLLKRHAPDILLMFGLAARTPWLRIESRARNARSALLPDASGALPARRAIAPGVPSDRRGRAPFTRLLAAARQTRVAARPSRDAGRYLCNYLYWRALEQTPDTARLVVFVHVPRTRRAGIPRARTRRRRPDAADLLRAGEALLRVLLAAARTNRPVPIQTVRHET